MAKITIKGTITKVGQPRKAGSGEVTEVILNKKFHDPETGALKNEDNYPLQIWQDKFAEFKKAFEKSSLMEVTGFINGRTVGEGENEKSFINFVAQSFKN